MDAKGDGSSRPTVQDSNKAIASRSGELEFPADSEDSTLIDPLRDTNGTPDLQFAAELNDRLPSILVLDPQLEHERSVRLRPGNQHTYTCAEVKRDRWTISHELDMRISPPSP
jgi:hypothetical protein